MLELLVLTLFQPTGTHRSMGSIQCLHGESGGGDASGGAVMAIPQSLQLAWRTGVPHGLMGRCMCMHARSCVDAGELPPPVPTSSPGSPADPLEEEGHCILCRHEHPLGRGRINRNAVHGLSSCSRGQGRRRDGVAGHAYCPNSRRNSCASKRTWGMAMRLFQLAGRKPTQLPFACLGLPSKTAGSHDKPAPRPGK